MVNIGFGGGEAAGFEGRQSGGRHGRKGSGDGGIFAELVDVVDAADEGGDVLREGVSECLVDREDLIPDGVGISSEGFHRERSDALFGELGEDAADDGVRVGFDGGHGELAGVEGVAVGEHGEMNVGVGVTGEADVADFPGFAGLVEGFDHAAGGEGAFDLGHGGDGVDLPEVEVVRAEAGEGLVGHLHRFLASAGVVSADLGHEENLVAFSGDAAAHEFLGLAVVVVPRIVKKVDAQRERLIDDAPGLFAAGGAERVAAEAQGGDGKIVVTEFSPGHSVGFGSAFEAEGGKTGKTIGFDEFAPLVWVPDAHDEWFSDSARWIEILTVKQLHQPHPCQRPQHTE